MCYIFVAFVPRIFKKLFRNQTEKQAQFDDFLVTAIEVNNEVIWSIMTYGSENWAFYKKITKAVISFETWCVRRRMSIK